MPSDIFYQSSKNRLTNRQLYFAYLPITQHVPRQLPISLFHSTGHKRLTKLIRLSFLSKDAVTQLMYIMPSAPHSLTTTKNEPSLLTKDALRRKHWIVVKELEGERGPKNSRFVEGGEYRRPGVFIGVSVFWGENMGMG